MTVWTLAASHHDASLATVPPLDEYRRKAPEYESKTKENEQEKKHKISVRAYRGSGDWPVGSGLYVLYGYWLMRVSDREVYEIYGHICT